jgi:hypothetical protein
MYSKISLHVRRAVPYCYQEDAARRINEEKPFYEKRNTIEK